MLIHSLPAPAPSPISMLTTDASRRPSSAAAAWAACTIVLTAGLITQHWNGGKGGVDQILVNIEMGGGGCGRNPGHGWAWHVEQDMQKVSATLKWWSGAVEENSLSLLRMAHRTRHRSSEHKIHFPVFLSQGWTRILEVLSLWSWLIHLKFRIRVVDVTCLQYSKFPFKYSFQTFFCSYHSVWLKWDAAKVALPLAFRSRTS